MKHFTDIKCVVINLKNRTDKKTNIQTELSSKKLKYSFYHPVKHENPKRGCLESHLHVIKDAIKNNQKYLFIMEDDAKFIGNLDDIAIPPSDWDMIYFGGTVHRVVNNDHKGYSRVHCWTTHAYIINLTKSNLVADILKANDYDGEIDRYYLEKIHKKYNAYMCNPMIIIQRDGFSDIENQEVSYSFMTHTLNGLRLPENTVDEEGNYVLKLPAISNNDLPFITIITPTYKRRKMFSMAMYNFDNFIYPRNKIEWIIVDDSPEDESVKDLLPPLDKRIRYLHYDVDKPMTIAMKRNIGVSNSSHDYIIHMDDDDYYPPESLLARVKMLIKYEKQNIQCVGSTMIGTYNIITNESSMSSDSPISLSEASMAYTKKFWEQRQFDDNCERGEHKHFTEGRLENIIDMPYSFILIAINHKNNFTEGMRNNEASLLKYSENNEKKGLVANYFDSFNEETQMFIMDLKKYIQT